MNMVEFINDADVDASVMLPGHYNLLFEDIELLKEHSTKHNMLLILHNVIMLSWEINCNSICTEKEIEIIWIVKKELTEKQRNIISTYINCSLKDIYCYINKCLKYIERMNTYKEKRKQANSIISNKLLRKRIFEKCNFQCALCNSTENLSIDHIIPIIQGGSNKEENLQVLCKKCNSSKGGE